MYIKMFGRTDMSFSPLYAKDTAFVTSCLVPCRTGPFSDGVYSQREVQVLQFRNRVLFWKGLRKNVTEAASPTVCPFSFA